MPDAAIVELPRNVVPEPDVVLYRVDLPDVLDQRLVLLREPTSARARAFRLLRHRLLSKGDPRVGLVTSAQAGEGKTTCAINLALAIAEETPHTALYLDVNLRRPALRDLFALDEVQGMLQGLDLRRYPVGALRQSRLRICAAVGDRAPDARLDRGIWPRAIADIREAYDYVIIDGPAVLDTADANVLAASADAVLFAARSDTSERTSLRQAIDQLAPAPVVGMVLLDT